MKYWIDMEWFCEHAGVIRIFEEGVKFGEPYDRSISFKLIEKFEPPLLNGKKANIEFVGLDKALTKDHFYAICYFMKKEGLGVVGTSYVNGQKKVREFCRNKWR